MIGLLFIANAQSFLRLRFLRVVYIRYSNYRSGNSGNFKNFHVKNPLLAPQLVYVCVTQRVYVCVTQRVYVCVTQRVISKNMYYYHY